MCAITANNRYMEMRSLCLIEPESDELVQLTYLCDLDSQISENSLIDAYGGLKNLGMANDKSFMQLGIYPVAIHYEKGGKIKRAKENELFEFEYISDNIYKPNPDGIKLLCRMKHLRMQAA